MNPLPSVFAILAQTTSPGAAPAPGQSIFDFLFAYGGLILLLILFFWMVSGAKRKEEKQRREMLSALKKGDRIRTVGGALGSIVELRDNRILVKVDETSNTKIWFLKEAIAGLDKDKDEKKDDKDTKSK